MSNIARASLKIMSSKVTSIIPNNGNHLAASNDPPLKYKVKAKCKTTKARVGVMTLRHGDVDTPVFMPVGTLGTVKGTLPEQLYKLDCRIILSNTYHLGNRPGIEILGKAKGLHKFMGWNRNLLTDSGGFQMVSLLELAEINENGVNFKSPYDGNTMLLTPEHSTQIQNSIGSDIMMQLDDVVKTTTTGPRVEEAMHRTVRWLDRCIGAHKRDDYQSIFPIVQGGTDDNLRKQCAEELLKRKVRGYAVGGLSGGECKDDFCCTVNKCTDLLPEDKPRYLMGVGYSVDLVVCVALGIDMFDCVFPTRTARFGVALVRDGQLKLNQSQFKDDLRPISEDCECTTCKHYTRAYLSHVVRFESIGSTLVTIHNVAYQLRLMKDIRESIEEDRFPEFIKTFMARYFHSKPIPDWIKTALSKVNIQL